MIKIAGLALLLLLTRVDPALSAPLRISYAAIAANIAGIWMAEGRGYSKNTAWMFSLSTFRRVEPMCRLC